MIENGLFILGGPEMQLHDILWDIHDGKTVVEARVRKIYGSSRYGGWSGRAMHGALRVSLVHVRVCVQSVGL